MAATALVLVASLLAGALLHLDAAVTRRVVAAQVTSVLEPTFAGRLVIEHIGRLGLHEVAGVRARVTDPEGVQVLEVAGARARFSAVALVRSLLDDGDLAIRLAAIGVDHADVSLDDDGDGDLRLANAFTEREDAAGEAPPDPAARQVRLEAPEVHIAHAWVHGSPAGALRIDADVASVEGHMHVGREGARLAIERARLATRGLPRDVDPKGTVRASMVIPSAPDAHLSLDGSFEGSVAAIPTHVRGRLDGARVDVVVDAHDPTGQGVRATFDELSVRRRVTLHGEVHGELPRLEIAAQLAVAERGHVAVEATLDLRDATRVDARIAARHLDLAALMASAPSSDIGLDAQGSLAVTRNGHPRGVFRAETLPGRLAGEPLPIVRARGALAEGALSATGHIVDPRLDAELGVDVWPAPEGTGTLVAARLQADARDLSRLPVIGAGGANVAGHASLQAQGRARLGERPDVLELRAIVRGGDITRGAQRAGDVRVVATLGGSLAAPTIEVGLHAGDVRSGRVHADTLEVRGAVEPGGEIVVRDAHLDLVEEDTLVSVTASRVRARGSRVSVEGVVVQGLGEPARAELRMDAAARTEVRAFIDAPALDLERLALLGGRGGAVRSGTLALHADVALERREARGEVHAEIASLATGDIEHARTRLDVVLDGRALGLEIHGAADGATFDLSTKRLLLDGSPADLASWRDAVGSADLEARVELSTVASFFPPRALPFREVGGHLLVRSTLRRDSREVPPEVSIHAETRGLVVSGGARAPRRVDGTTMLDVPRWRSAGVDLALDAKADATSGLAAASVRAFDARGIVVSVDAKADVPYQSIVAAPASAREKLVTSPLRIKVVVPERALSALPTLAGPRALEGTIAAELDVTGTALEPHASLVAHARAVRARGPEGTAYDADLEGTYDGSLAGLSMKMRSQQQDVLALTSRVEARLRDLLDQPGRPLDWQAGARVTLARFPLESVAAFARRRIRGHVSGEAVLEGLHRDATLTAKLTSGALRMGRAVYPRGDLNVEARSGKLVGSARLEQANGYASVHASTGMAWGSALVPTLDPRSPSEARLEARAFRLAFLRPFFRKVFNQLDGRVDGLATITSGPAGTRMQGRVALSEGLFQLAALGPQLNDVRATATLEPHGVIRVADLHARGVAGELRGEARIETRGLAFEAATASFTVPKGEPLDLSLLGQPLGQFSGKLKIVARAQPGGPIAMKVDVPELVVEVARSTKGGIQELSDDDEDDGIEVGVYRDDTTFVELPLDRGDLEPREASDPADAAALSVDIHLANVDVTYGQIAALTLRGDPHVEVVGDDVRLTGNIEVKYGKIEFQGKEFTIEKATLTFQPGEPSNPRVDATASWTAQDGTKVFADFVGPAETGTVTLRSEPSRPKNEIFALILFGTADGVNAAPIPGRGTSTATRAAVSVGGGLAAQGLNEALDDLTGIQATARVDTSRANNPAPEIEFQIARRFSIELTHVLGTPPLSRPDKYLITVDWRFKRNWSIATTVGERGTVQTDTVWQKRY